MEKSKVGKDDVIEFSGKVEIDQNTGIAKPKTNGTELINDLMNNNNGKDIIISLADDHINITLPLNVYSEGENSANGAGTGSNIYWDPTSTGKGEYGLTKVVNEDGTFGAPSFIVLGHELGHAQLNKNGQNNVEVDPNLTDPDTGYKGRTNKAELSVREKENLLRKDHNIGKRKVPQ